MPADNLTGDLPWTGERYVPQTRGNWNIFVFITGGRNLATRSVADVRKFSEALYGWANSIHWTDDFRDRNKAFLENPPK